MSKRSKSKRDKRRKQEIRERNRQPTQAVTRQNENPKSEASPLKMSVEFSKLGAPGIQHELYIVGSSVPGRTIGHEQTNAALKDSEERNFQIIVHLGKEPGSFSGDLDITMDPSKGGSLIYKHPDADFTIIEATFGRVAVHLNARGEFSALELQCLAKNVRDVFSRYSDALATLVDHVAFHHNVPLFVRYVALWDAKNNILTASYTVPYRSTVLSEDWLTYDLALRPYYALYREALTNPSVFYQFLCYVKILEGVIRKAYPAIIREAKSAGTTAPRLDVRVEEDPEIRGLARNWIGKSIQQTFNDYLQPEFRNAIAHFSNEDEEPLVVSNYIAGATISNNILLARQCARGAITAIEQILHKLKSTLGIEPSWMR
ncbi:hypothetical protein SAMN05444354_1444 [Stigmatella aurantiaca]|uniref:Uncharacterized protein n=1 Tax=Stigmatella aurantiaca TaxID=41 RepID=A0A1H8FYZ8_STIAU|nr:methylamine utilization protein MauJ [Stigmatella aurantiaca]SEN36735.1 hypothetical protein SAMN05444354_1444 [Stigmatella aurantiaca]